MRTVSLDRTEGKSSPAVTVIVPAHNAGEYLSSALDSARAQTLRDFELIVVDDGSSDDTGEIAERHASQDSRIKVMRQPNKGVGAARNAAIKIARGKYVAPLDADDVWLPAKLERQVALLEKSGDSLGLAYCWSKLIDRAGFILNHSSPWTFGGDILHTMVYTNIVGNASVPLFRTAAVREVGGYLTRDQQGGAQGCEDWDLILKVSARSQAGVVPDHLVGYRMYGTSMSQNVMQMAASYVRVVEGLHERQQRIPPKLLRWSAGHFYTYLASVSYCNGGYRTACCLARRAAVADPAVLTDKVLMRVFLVSLARTLFGPRFIQRKQKSWSPAGAGTASANGSSESTFFDRLQHRRLELLAKNWRSLYSSEVKQGNLG